MASQASGLPNILVAEDDPVHRKVVVGALAEIAHGEIFEAVDGVEAQEILRQNRIEVAVTDLMMPRMGGLDLIAWGKEESLDTVWVILSSMDTFDNSVAAIRLGAFDFLAKPIETQKLEASVRSALRHQQLVSEKEQLDRQLTGALESSPSGVVMVDAGGEIMLVNRETESTFGYHRDELVGQQVEILVPDWQRSSHPEHRSEFLGNPSRRTMGGRNLSGRRKDGSEFPIEVGLNPVELDSGMAVIASVSDRTAQQQVERALSRAKGASIAFVAAAVVGVMLIAIGALGVPSLQSTNDELDDVKNASIPLMMEISAFYALQLEQDGMFERALHFAEKWQLGTDEEADFNENQYDRYLDLYNDASYDVVEHIDKAVGVIDGAPNPGEEGTLAELREALGLIKSMYKNQTDRATSVFELVNIGEVQTALELAEEVGQEDQEIEASVSDVLRDIQSSIERTVANSRDVYALSLNVVVLLAGIGIATLIAASIVGWSAVRSRQQLEAV